MGQGTSLTGARPAGITDVHQAGVVGAGHSTYDHAVTHAQDERAALAALLEETGPDGPTLCEGWRTRDLVAHLVLRERRPDASAGMIGGPLAAYTARVQQQYLDRYSYPQLIALFRAGPPRLSVFAIPGADDAANTVEYFVHHEDVRRAAPEWTERPIEPSLSQTLWKRLKGARMFLRSAPTGVVLATELPGNIELPGNTGSPGNEARQGRLDMMVAKPGAQSVTVTGSPAELTLWAMGRVSAAHVTFDGFDEAVERLTGWRS
jgi:uncharacterized protein (TIGR03085 family)